MGSEQLTPVSKSDVLLTHPTTRPPHSADSGVRKCHTMSSFAPDIQESYFYGHSRALSLELKCVILVDLMNLQNSLLLPLEENSFVHVIITVLVAFLHCLQENRTDKMPHSCMSKNNHIICLPFFSL